MITIKVQKLRKIKSLKKDKIIFFGNGGSAAICNHFSAIDFSKNLKIKNLTFNEDASITCLANDYGYENWIMKAIELNANKNDLVVFISSSGNSFKSY